MSIEEFLFLLGKKTPSKVITDSYNKLKVDDRKKMLSYLSTDEKEALITKIRNQAVANFWTHEQELIKNGKSTRNWTPEQIEDILHISEKTGVISINGDVAHDVNGKSYYGHHMLNVAEHPEYAGDWRNIQALDYDEHYNGAHDGDTSKPTYSFYDVSTGGTIDIDVTMLKEFADVKDIESGYIDTQKCIFKSDTDMKSIYSQYDSYTDGEKLALKNIELSMDSNGGLEDFNRALDVAGRYKSPDFENKMGIMKDDAVTSKYNYLKNMDETDISTFKAYEYFKSRGVEDSCIEKLGIRSDNTLLDDYKFMESGDESLDMLRAYEYQNAKLGNTMTDTKIYFDSDGKMAGLSCFDDSLPGKSLYEVSLADAENYLSDADMTTKYIDYDSYSKLDRLKACQYDYERTKISNMVDNGISSGDGITLKTIDQLKEKYTWLDDSTDPSVIKELQLAEYRDAKYKTNTADDIELHFDENGKMSCIVDHGYETTQMADVRSNSVHTVKTSDIAGQASNAHMSSICPGFDDLTDYQKLQIRQLELEAANQNYDKMGEILETLDAGEGKQIHYSVADDGAVSGIDISEITGGETMDMSGSSTVFEVSADGTVKAQLSDTPDGNAGWKNHTDSIINNESITHVNGVPAEQFSNGSNMLNSVNESNVNAKINNAITDIPANNTDADALAKNIVAGKTTLIDVVEDVVDDVPSNPTTGVSGPKAGIRVGAVLSILGLAGDVFDGVDVGITFTAAYGQYKNGDIEGASDTLGNWGMSTLGGMAGGAIAGAALGFISGPLGWGALLGASLLGGYGGSWLWNNALDPLNDDYDSAGNAQPPRDPLVIDLGTLGIDLTAIENGVHFDLDKNGFAEKTAWIGKQDGFLVLDRNQDNFINDGGELFGDQVQLKNGTTSVSGFEALAELDSNGDGVIDANDEMWNSLCVWVDANQDGLSHGELRPLSTLGIQSISLEVTREENVDTATGTMEAEYAMVTFEDGTQRRISEFWFPVDASDTTQGTEDGEIVETTGNVPNIHVAIEADETGVLAQLYEEFQASDDFVEKRYLLKKILYHVTDATDISANSRGGNIDARDLHVIEAFMGREFNGVGGKNPNFNAASILKGLYTKIENLYFNILNEDALEGDYLDCVIIYDNQDGDTVIDLRLINFYIESQVAEDANVDSVVYSVGAYLAEVDKIYNTNALSAFKGECTELSVRYAEIIDYAKSGNTYLGSVSGDYFGGTNASDFVFGDNGNDTLRGGNGNDIVYGGADSDSLYGDNGNDSLYGEAGGDTIRGGAGDDKIYGAAEGDILYGESGNDTIYGEDGNDILSGGAGADVLDGGAGLDAYIFARGYGRDTIVEAGETNILRFIGLKSTDVLVNGVGQYDVAVTIKGTADVLVIKDFRKGEEYQDWNLEFSNGKMHVTAPESPFRFIYGGAGDDALKAPVDGSLMYAFDGDDTVLASKGEDIIYGGAGNDIITAREGDDIVFDMAGNDTIDSGAGNDIISDGQGDDTYVFGKGYGTDLIDDSQGITTISLTDGLTLEDILVHLVGENVVITLKEAEDKLIIHGYSGNNTDYIIKTETESVSINDFIAEAGEGYVAGAQWSDYLPNNSNSEIIAGGAGDDFALGTEEMEYIFGDSGNDRITAGGGNDMVFGGTGDDDLFGETGDDVIFGGRGNEYISGGEGNDIIVAQAGDDFTEGGAGDDTYYYNVGDGKDSIMDSEGLNRIMFGDGIEASKVKAYRSNWNDLLVTFEGLEDTLTIKNYCVNENARSFELVFADGTIVDAVAQDSPLRTIYGSDESEYMTSIYTDGITFVGNEGDDQLVGSAGSDSLYGGEGNDRVTADAGNDVLDGGTGNDYLYGGSGNDTYTFCKGYGTDVIGDGEGVNSININGYSASQIKAYRTNWNDITITFTDSEDKLVIEGFFTSAANRNFNITFNGGHGFHATAINSPLRKIYDTDGNDYIIAMDNQGVTLVGSEGADGLNGGEGADVLDGGASGDRLCGNGGNDYLNGGVGNDYLYGGAGNDTYQFDIGSGIDTLNDWEGINTISFGAGLKANDLKAYRTNWNDLTICFEGVEDKLVIQGYFNSGSNCNFEVRFADGTKYAYDDAKNPIKEVYANTYDDWMNAWSDKGIILHGADGNDTISGGAGEDTLYGDNGNDSLFGYSGNDSLDGGAGNDYLNGGEGDDIYRFGSGFGSDVIEDNSGDSKVVLLDMNPDAVIFSKNEQSELVLTMNDGQDVLKIRNFNSETYTFEFADGVSGTVDSETAEFTKTVTEEELIQSNVELLNQIYEEDAFTPMLSGGTEQTLVSDIAETTTLEELDKIADQTDLQVMILTENMSAFAGEENISDSVNITDTTSDVSATAQLLASSQTNS